jgi:hypothetical protein
MADLTRRSALVLPFLLAACGGDDEPGRQKGRDFPPLRYGYLPPLRLNVRRIDMADGFVPPSGDDEIGGASPASPGETLFAMARDRLKPVGANGQGVFQLQTASITRRRDALNGVLAVRLDVRNDDGGETGYAEARVTASRNGSIGDRRAAAYDILKSMMDDMNVELEFQIRRQLRSWLLDTPPEPKAAEPVEKLPLPPPPPPKP